MHKSGVILAWFVALVAIGAVLMTSKMLDVRGSWLKTVENNKSKIQKNEADLEAKETENKTLRNDLTRLMLGWDRYWDANVTVANQQTGEIQVNIGGNQGLGSAQQGDDPAAQPVVFAFQPDQNNPNGVSYVGAFRVNALEPNGAQLIAVNPPQDGEVATWKNGVWRLRALVPPNYISTLRTLRDNLVEREQQLTRKKDRIQDLNRLLTSAQERLEVRVSELIGSENAPQDEILPVELRKGLVAGLEEEEKLRNQEFQETDRLRRDLLNVYQKQLDLVQEVSKLTKQLPQQTPADY
ncbi:hypothetical protein [uncultured Gimesia sp.]|mgnify:CR=1 FL=1|uniref:hypothetical protein n=1 Tax=uncultured Gimesia sp. TaxID=1678688 RepID=UPI0030D911E2|tara:strand:- start:70927 stop:71814 length:888 start_codon:yes stop_codon:yes gene_type:complete